MPRAARQPVAARGRRAAKPGEGAPESGPKGTQRERLLDAMVELSAGIGYQSVSIAHLSAHAGVSSATFYQLFEGKEDCLVAAYRAVAERVLGQMRPVARDAAPTGEDWPAAARAALGRLLGAVQRDPDGGRVLYIEAMAGGPRMLEERRRVLGEFERRAEGFLDSVPAGASTLDLPAIALVGATRAIVARHLRTNAQDELAGLAGELVGWLQAYAVPAGRERWSTGPRALLAPGRAGRAPASGDRAPALQRLPRGRHGLPAGVVARSQRTRIVYATAHVMMAKGYAGATIADIVTTASVSRDVFYEHFVDKHHAFLEAQQHATHHLLDVCAAAYFAAEDWPARVWHGLRALIELIVENPAISHLRLVACYGAGAEAIRRAEEITRSFTIFLEEGYRHRPEARELPRLSSQAIAGAVYEVIRRHVARRDYAGLLARLPQLAYLAIAPFTGPREAARLLEELSAGAASRAA